MPYLHRDVWTSSVGDPPLCRTCSHLNLDPRRRVMCRADPLRTTAWTCRDYDREPGSDDA